MRPIWAICTKTGQKCSSLSASDPSLSAQDRPSLSSPVPVLGLGPMKTVTTPPHGLARLQPITQASTRSRLPPTWFLHTVLLASNQSRKHPHGLACPHMVSPLSLSASDPSLSVTGPIVMAQDPSLSAQDRPKPIGSSKAQRRRRRRSRGGGVAEAQDRPKPSEGGGGDRGVAEAESSVHKRPLLWRQHHLVPRWRQHHLPRQRRRQRRRQQREYPCRQHPRLEWRRDMQPAAAKEEAASQRRRSPYTRGSAPHAVGA